MASIRIDTFSSLCKIDVSFFPDGQILKPARSAQAEVAELADAHGSGPCTRKGVGVRVPSSAPFLKKRLLKPASTPGCDGESIGGEGYIESTLSPLSRRQDI